ncbi:MAG: AsmA family protein, partial [Shewanella sp.]
MKLLKWLLVIVATFGVALTLYLTVFFDSNSLKVEIVKAVKQQTGRELVISQELSWTLLPQLGLELSGVTLANPAGLTPKPMLEVKDARLQVALRTLLSQKIEVVRLSLDGVVMHLVTLKDGRSSFDGLLGQVGAEKTAPAMNGNAAANTEANAEANAKPTANAVNPTADTLGPADKGVSLGGIDIQEITITNVQIHHEDERLGQSHTLALDSFSLTGFTLGAFAPFTFSVKLLTPELSLSSVGSGELKLSPELDIVMVDKLNLTTTMEGQLFPDKPLTSALTLTGQIALDKKQLTAQVNQLTVGELQANATVKVNYAQAVPKVTVDIKAGDILLDKLLPRAAVKKQGESASNNTNNSENKSKALAGGAAKEPDLRGLKSVDLQLTLTATALKYAKVALQNLQLRLTTEQGVLDISALSADLYQGKLVAKARIDGRSSPATYQFDKQLTDVQL